MYHQITSNKRKSVIVVVCFLAVWLLAGFVIGEIGSASTGGAIVGTVVLGLLGVGAALYAYYLGAPTVLSAMGAHEADPGQYQQLYNIVQTLVIGDGLPLPKVYVIDDPSPNAFATGRDPQHAAVSVTTGLLQMMNREELEGVLSPEKFNHAVAAMCIDNPEEHHGSFFSRLFETHPPIEERIATLEKIASVQQT